MKTYKRHQLTTGPTVRGLEHHGDRRFGSSRRPSTFRFTGDDIRGNTRTCNLDADNSLAERPTDYINLMLQLMTVSSTLAPLMRINKTNKLSNVRTAIGWVCVMSVLYRANGET